jgi:hypothetical protein
VRAAGLGDTGTVVLESVPEGFGAIVAILGFISGRFGAAATAAGVVFELRVDAVAIEGFVVVVAAGAGAKPAGFSAVVELGIVTAALAEMVEIVEAEALLLIARFDALIPVRAGLIGPRSISLVAIMLENEDIRTLSFQHPLFNVVFSEVGCVTDQYEKQTYSTDNWVSLVHKPLA